MDQRKKEAQSAFDNEQYELAIVLMTPFAEAGDAAMQCNLGTLYQLGLGCKRDLTRAVYWLEKAADAGSGLAAHNLGTLYMTCLPDWPVDSKKNEIWRARAQALGYSPFRPDKHR